MISPVLDHRPWHDIVIPRILRNRSIKRMQEGSDRYDRMYAAVALSDGGVVLGGYFKGAWNEVVAEGEHDFAAVKLDTAGTLVWRWQVKQGR